MNEAIREVIDAYEMFYTGEYGTNQPNYSTSKRRVELATAELAAIEKVLADIKTNCQQVLDMSHTSEKNAVGVALADFIIKLVESVE